MIGVVRCYTTMMMIIMMNLCLVWTDAGRGCRGGTGLLVLHAGGDQCLRYRAHLGAVSTRINTLQRSITLTIACPPNNVIKVSVAPISVKQSAVQTKLPTLTHRGKRGFQAMKRHEPCQQIQTFRDQARHRCVAACYATMCCRVTMRCCVSKRVVSRCGVPCAQR